jgi:peptidoglycan/xylan/chitin deacetylase (PgdA/CDA1 family)
MIINPVPWPNNAKCAVSLTFDVDTDSALHLTHLEKADTMVSVQSLLKYDEVAIPRILQMYRDFDIKQTFFVPAWCIEKYPHVVEQIVNDGHEIGHHGYLHEHPNELSKEDEEYWLVRSIETIKNFTGQKPRGWRAPLYNFSKHSAELLVKYNFLYDTSLMADDVPYIIKAENGKVVELPTHWGVDDWPQFGHFTELNYKMPIKSATAGIGTFMDEFEAAYEYGGMFIPVWHPFITGRIARLRLVYKMIEEMQRRGDVWFAPLEEIANHVHKCIDDGSYKPREIKMPYYNEGIPEINNTRILQQK